MTNDVDDAWGWGVLAGTQVCDLVLWLTRAVQVRTHLIYILQHRCELLTNNNDYVNITNGF